MKFYWACIFIVFVSIGCVNSKVHVMETSEQPEEQQTHQNADNMLDQKEKKIKERQHIQISLIDSVTENNAALFETCPCIRLPNSAGKYANQMNWIGQKSWLKGLNLYLIVDTALNETWFNTLMREETDWLDIQSAFYETPLEQFKDVAPYILRIAPDSAILEWAFKHYENQNQSVILITSYSGLESIAAHLKKFRMVKTDTKPDLWNFRYYNGTILEAYLNSLIEKQLSKFMGPINSIFIWHPNQQRPEVKRIPDTEKDNKLLVITRDQNQIFTELVRDKFKKKIIRSLRSLDKQASDEALRQSVEDSMSFCKKVNLINRDSIMGCTILIHFYGLNIFKTDDHARSIADHTKPEALRKTVIHNMLTLLRERENR